MNETDYYRHLEETADDGLPNFDIDLTPLEIEEAEVGEKIEANPCTHCNYGKGSIECLNCFVGGVLECLQD